MARIPLRSYHREIDNLIDRGQIEEAIAHSKNILKQFPKNIETYRLLGKAYLESQRYSEASDILQRLLSVVPDDFVSQLGMSVIREDEGNLDASIWHMERAYEVQPFNRAIQDELRRLYGRRDGSEPPRIRLTRGSLVRMYARGDLYSQAIAETRAALAEDHQRLDLRVLLAQMYYLSGQKVEAAEISSSLIGKLPYCLEANRILMEILPSTSRAEEARVFQHRVYDLDPYAEFVTPNTPTSAQVPEQAVMVERVDWQPTMQESQSPDWTRTIGVKWEEDKEENLPEWLNNFGTGTPPANATAIIPAQQNEIIPDFMREAGWSQSEHAGDAPPSLETSEEPVPTSAEEDLEQVDIPDWLKEMAPKSIQTESETDDKSLDWINNILPAPGAPFSTPDVSEQTPLEEEALPEANDQPAAAIQSLAADTSLQDSIVKDEVTQTTSDMLSAYQPAPAGESEDAEDDSMDWLKEFGSQDQPSANLAAPVVMDEANTAVENETPAWLNTEEQSGKEDFSWIQQDPNKNEQVSEELPAWLREEALENPAPSDEIPAWLTDSPAPDLVEQPAVDQTEWINEPVKDEAQGVPSVGEASNDALSAWLSELKTTDEEIVPGEVPAAEVNPADEIPDWLKTTDKPVHEAAAFEQAAAPTAVVPEETPPSMAEPAAEMTQPASMEAPTQAEDGANLQEMDLDSAMAWLEGLAAKQGADEGSLKITAPELRTETPPDWIAGYAQSTPADEAVEPIQATEDELPAWLVEEKSVDAAAPEPIQAQTPEPVSQGEILEPVTLQPESVFPPEPSQPAAEERTQPLSVRKPAETAEVPQEIPAAPQPALDDIDSAMAWMEALAAKQGADADSLKITATEDRSETPPDWIASLTAAETPAVDAVSAEAEPVQAVEEQPISSWTQVEEPPVQAEPELAPVEDIPGWLKDLSEAETPVTDASPGGNEPVEAVEEPQISAWEQEEEPAVPAEPILSPVDDLPDWLKGLDLEGESTSVAEEAAQPQAPDRYELPDWLAEPEPASGPTEPSAVWVPEPEAASEQLPPPEPLAAPAAEAAPNLEDMDSAMAWMEALASKQGAEADSLKITSLEQRNETTPDWIAELAKNQPEPGPEAVQAQVEEVPAQVQERQAAPSEPIQADLTPAAPPAPVETSQMKNQPAVQEPAETEIPAWLLNYEQEQNQKAKTWEPSETVQPAPVQASATDDSITVWLQRHHPDTGELKTSDTGSEISTPEVSPEAAGVAGSVGSPLNEAQAAIRRGETEAAAQIYSDMIKTGENLDSVVNDLRAAVNQHPGDVDLWQTLGDAHIRANHIQDALDAYTIAEELLR